MKIPKEIERAFEQAQKPTMPHETQEKVQQYLVHLQRNESTPMKKARRTLRTVSAAVAASAVFVTAITLVLHHRYTRPSQTANQPNHAQHQQKPTAYDYQSVLGFTPMVPSKIPTNWLFTYASESVSVGASYKESTFTIEYGPRTITEQAGKYAAQDYPPKHYYKKIVGHGLTIYESTSFDWSQHPEAADMFLMKGGVIYTLNVTTKTSVQQCVQILQNLSVPYKKPPMGVRKQYNNPKSQTLTKILPFQCVLPRSIPKGYHLVNTVANTASGDSDTGKAIGPGTLMLSYDTPSDTAPGNPQLAVIESPGSTVPFSGSEIKIGSATIHYSSVQGIAWHDAAKGIVIRITGGQHIHKAQLLTFAKTMIPST